MCSILELNFYADKVFLVVSPGKGGDKMRVLLDGKVPDAMVVGEDIRNGEVILDHDRLYEIIDLHGKRGKHLLQLEFPQDGTAIYAFTFG